MARALMSALAVCLSVFGASSAQCQDDFPNRPIKIVVPYSAGSTGDITTRIVGQKMSSLLGQPIVVENRPGANGFIGMQYVAQSKPDGYTLVVASSSLAVVAPAITKSMNFDPLKDFTPISLISNTPIVLVVAKDSPINTVQDLIASAKKEPATYGNLAPAFQLIMEQLRLQSQIGLVSVGYRGPSDALNDLIGGRITVFPDSLGSATRNLQAGRTKAIAVLSASRLPSLPQVPTMAESGLKDFVFVGWNAVLAPAGTPTTIVQRLSAAMKQALAAPEVISQFETLLLEPTSLSPDEVRSKMVQETVRYIKIANDVGIEKQ